MQGDLLRFTTAGSVDDGKSTLIGRLLFDTKTAFQDQLDAVADASRRRGDERVNLALLTDGLRSEREQGITIDVAYRYFATLRRKFIIADTPGHLQYTRNMVTGASTAGLAIILIDARHGLVEQSRRHALIASMLRIPHIAVAVNKMDLVEWSEARFHEIEADVRAFTADLGVQLTVLPISALTGANIVDRAPELAWFSGPTLLEHLETVPVASDHDAVGLRFPVQWVIRPQSSATELHDYRGFAGALAAGTVRPGDPVVVLPSGRTTTIARVERGGVFLDEVSAPASVTLHLVDNVDVSRGDMIAAVDAPPAASTNLVAMVCWMAERPLAVGDRYLVKHTTRTTKATITELPYRLDVTTGERRDATTLGLNDLGRIHFATQQPLIWDPYERSRTTGSFVLIDEATNATVAAGMLV
jgi:sulfate adenylyltransferase large subunit